MSAAYSAMVRSLKNFPELATFRMPLRAHPMHPCHGVTIRLQIRSRVGPVPSHPGEGARPAAQGAGISQSCVGLLFEEQMPLVQRVGGTVRSSRTAPVLSAQRGQGIRGRVPLVVPSTRLRSSPCLLLGIPHLRRENHVPEAVAASGRSCS